ALPGADRRVECAHLFGMPEILDAAPRCCCSCDQLLNVGGMITLKTWMQSQHPLRKRSFVDDPMPWIFVKLM
ncbi:MAG: hypothetical protein C5B58_15005, partial [Acidobacteria bacterium]